MNKGSYLINKKCGLHLFFLLISLGMYFGSPMKYSQVYCIILFLLFVANSFLLYVQDRKNEPLGFNVLFTISFFLVSYIYPVFTYSIMPDYSMFAYSGFSSEVITRATALANVAYAVYSVGYTRNFLVMNIGEKAIPICLISTKQNDRIIALEIILFVLIVIAGGLEFFSDTYSGEGEANTNALFRFTYTFFQPLILFGCLVDCTMKGFKNSVVIFFIILVLLSTGTRTLPLCVMSVYLCYYSLRYHLSIQKVFVTLFVVFVFLSLIGHWRGGGELSSISDNELTLFDYARDFIICNRNLYAIYDHVNNESITYGISSLSYILAPIPFLQSFVSFLFDIPAYNMRSESLTSYWVLGEGNPLGLGTHIVGDIYLSFGFIGVLFLFYFLGKIVTSSRMKSRMGSQSAFVIYYILLSGAIFMCRGSFFYSLKNLIWVLLFWNVCNYKHVQNQTFHNSI